MEKLHLRSLFPLVSDRKTSVNCWQFKLLMFSFRKIHQFYVKSEIKCNAFMISIDCNVCTTQINKSAGPHQTACEERKETGDRCE